MSDNDDSLYGDSVYEAGVEDADDFDPAEQLTGEDPEEPFDTGYSPPEYRPAATRYGTTDLEEFEGESLEQRLAEEEPDIEVEGDDTDASLDSDTTLDSDDADVEADPRAGRLVAPDEGAHDDLEKDEVAFDVGRAGNAASAEEAAVHVIDADEDFEGVLESDSVDD
ncbi:DUF5709 domain-containing protein [Jatrophihabitans sp. DSM 45814]